MTQAQLKTDTKLGSPERFGYEWKKYADILPEHQIQLSRWLGPIKLESFKGKTVLDAGCGMGRNSYWVAKSGAASVVSIDVDDNSLNSARKNLKPLKNSKVLKCSIYDIDQKVLGQFDRVMCIGVLHHLSKPEDALQKLWSCVKPGGELLLWCYGKKGNEFFLPAIQLTRWIGSRLPIKVSHLFSKGIALAAWPVFKVYPWKVEYYKNLKKYSYQNYESIIFDQILPRTAFYWSEAEMRRLVQPLGGEVSISLVQGNSWSVQVLKKA